MDNTFDKIIALIVSGLWSEAENLIIASGQNISQSSSSGRNLLPEVAHYPGSGRVIQLLIKLGSDVNALAADGSSALANAIIGGSRYGANTLEEVKTLVESGAKLDARADSGYPPLHWAIVNCKLDHAKLLLRLGADPDQKTFDFPAETATDVAKRMKYVEAIEVLSNFEKNKLA